MYQMRCTCNKPLAHLNPAYEGLLASGVSIQEALDNIGLTRYCCRVTMMSPVDVFVNPKPDRELIDGMKEATRVAEVEKISTRLAPIDPVKVPVMGNIASMINVGSDMMVPVLSGRKYDAV